MKEVQEFISGIFTKFDIPLDQPFWGVVGGISIVVISILICFFSRKKDSSISAGDITASGNSSVQVGDNNSITK